VQKKVGVITAPGKGGMGTRTKQIEPTWQLVPGSPMIFSLVYQ